ncbi:sigma-54-dependent transcriptional regulator [Thalassomonas actiniarum]|uniref:Sigma-54-dependent Fis family transcriptional regulator n=1 Tax=Thalassomonas actiniarum TaxID=485447 RepID=A0AAF0C5B5_9GAMM|nr:sigma-54 dependent transcriptional regulator [Thalassomonas actiniarum]WDE00690.1 sigma-54-dependent Fis family transcriptional regulator [Thalassomonas actiniarum]
MSKACILVVDDRPDIRLSASFVLEDNGYQVQEAESPYQAKEIIQNSKVDLILLDMNYSLDTTSGDEGLEFLSWLAKAAGNIPAVAMTAWSNVELAVKAMQLGAGDFLEKPWKNQRLLQVIEHQLTLTGLKVQNQKLQQRLEPEKSDDYTWRSPCMQELMRQIESVAQTDVTILLTGDNGTGKSQLAKYIHQLSNVQSGPFISVNMGAISENLFESEMFGHTKGAFTDAKSNRIGRFELAKDGTLFLDEIANIPLSQQAKLLRVLESGEYEVLGSSQTQQTNIRLVSASNGDFSKLIANDEFREDLFYRLNTLEFRVPSLREREQDIIPLAQHFVKTAAGKYQKPAINISTDAQQALLEYHWPGNIRELSHLMERAVLLTRHDELQLSDLHLNTQTAAGALPMMTLEQAERKLIKQALAASDNHIAKAAALLGLTKSSMYRRLEKYPDLQS